MKAGSEHIIFVEAAVTLDGLFRERVKRTPDRVSHVDFDPQTNTWRSRTWADMYREIGRWQAALAKEELARGARVAIMMRNCPEWVMFDQAAMGLDLVVVPLYTVDRPDNVAYILQDCGAKLLLFDTREQWEMFDGLPERLKDLARILILHPGGKPFDDPRVRAVSEWLPASGEVRHVNDDGQKLASIIYTSGTTGRPKGVMLSHHNMLTNAFDSLQRNPVWPEDEFLSFLPLSHTFERTVGYYLTVMAGAKVSYARSIPQLAEDLLSVKPTLLISVPRIYERVWAAIKAKLDAGPPARKKLFLKAVEIGWDRFEHSQGRGPWKPSFLLWPVLERLVAAKVLERLGGRLRMANSGGAALSPEVSKVFIGLGLPIVQGFGMTETSPVVSCNTQEDNVPASVGKPIPNVQVKLGEANVLLVKGPNVMLGYWNNPQATKAVLSPDGWLNTGDTARIDEAGRIYITGRVKEIIVLANGEKVPPADMELAILQDPIFEQVMVIGEAKPYLSAIVVLNRENWTRVAKEAGLDPEALDSDAVEQFVLKRIGAQIREFPGYAQVRRVALSMEPWSVDNGMLTPTLKIKRPQVMQKYAAEIDKVYAGH